MKILSLDALSKTFPGVDSINTLNRLGDLIEWKTSRELGYDPITQPRAYDVGTWHCRRLCKSGYLESRAIATDLGGPGRATRLQFRIAKKYRLKLKRLTK